MRTIQKTVYMFSELTDKAKEKAREWYRDASSGDEWWEYMYGDAEAIGLKITSFDLDRKRHAEGKFIESAMECADKVLKEHGSTCETFKTASAFLKERDECVDTWPKDENGDNVDEWKLDEKLDEIEDEFLKSILEDYSILLQQESEYVTSNEQVDENITINEYEFDENGKLI